MYKTQYTLECKHLSNAVNCATAQLIPNKEIICRIMKSVHAVKRMKNAQDIPLYDKCPICSSKRKIVTLSGILELKEEQEAWVPLSVSNCVTCGQTTIHAFHPEMFTFVLAKDKNRELPHQGEIPEEQGRTCSPHINAGLGKITHVNTSLCK